jgi:serine/threonine protein kinase
MEKLKPPEEEQGVSTWSKIQMAETPTLLPHLKFHDLVFGHDLGSGAFGTVRYARLIDRLKTRSHWAEYAVKVISTEKIRELGYEASVQREIAVLRILSHPGIARLISSFRFREGAYLVLEYASGGDLHSLLRKHGSLDHKSTRFVVGEIVAALSSIHELGLVYSDLKAENVLITEPGHIKLTDFGGCRPVTKVAKSLVDSIAKDLLKKLRDGDWKAKDADGDDAMHDETDTEMEEDDDRIEGTTSYLPPEVVMGSIPTVAADSWALGCLTYQCLSGRPPFLEADDEMTRRRIVNFDIEEQQSSEVDRLFEDKLGSGIEPNARELIKSLLQRNPSLRPDMGQVAETDFFRQEGVDVFSLHNEPAFPLDVGSVAPLPDAQWSRRQFSSIWAPQPVAYDISLPDDNPRPFLTVKSNSSPIREGEEASGFFSPSGKLPKPLGKIAERLVSHLSS